MKTTQHQKTSVIKSGLLTAAEIYFLWAVLLGKVNFTPLFSFILDHSVHGKKIRKDIRNTS